MRRKNTESSVGTLVGAALYITIVFLLLGALLAMAFQRSFRLFDPDKSLFFQLLGWIVFLSGIGLLVKSVSASLWLWGTEIGSAVKNPGKGRWKKPLAALGLFGLIALGPAWFNIRFDADKPEGWMLLYALYLLLAGLVTIAPCALIYGLVVSLAEKETEREEREEAKKY